MCLQEQMKENIRRVKKVGSMLAGLAEGFTSIKAWTTPHVNLIVYGCLVAFAMYPSKTLAGLLVWLLISEYV